MRTLICLLMLVSFLMLTQSCSKEDTSLVIPDTYSFENVSYSGQTQRLDMLQEIKTYTGLSQEPGFTLDAQRLSAMYRNDAESAQWSASYDGSKTIKSKTFEAVQEDFEQLIIDLAADSQSELQASPGIAGRITSTTNPEKTYLLSETGLDRAQLLEKGLMGACLYYQATAVYFGPEKMNADNTASEAGSATEMEHHWDEAFGYLGVPNSYPQNKQGIRFWGSYLNKRNPVLDNARHLMQAMITGRAAIGENLLAERDQAIETARIQWERLVAACAIHYLNQGIAEFEDKAIAMHALSEAIGFIYSLQFNPDRELAKQEVETLLVILAKSKDFSHMNLYETTIDELMQVRQQLAEHYNMELIKEEL